MAYEVKVTRQCQTTIPKAIRKKYMISEGDKIIYVDLGDHVAIVPVPKNPIKDLALLKVDAKAPISEMRKEALRTAQKLVDEKLNR
jgi:AbrB family looped-hinge helix DNA binding protein